MKELSTLSAALDEGNHEDLFANFWHGRSAIQPEDTLISLSDAVEQSSQIITLSLMSSTLFQQYVFIPVVSFS